MEVLVLSTLLILLQCASLNCINLGEEEDALLKNVLQEFENDPNHGRYDRIIEQPFSSATLIPKIFIWCPIRHNSIVLKCPLHGCPLVLGKWTDILNSPRNHPRNPRLIYDLSGNVILIQAFYNCNYNLPELRRSGHSYLSASSDVLDVLPAEIKITFPIILQQRSGFTVRLYDYMMTGVYQGQNFMETSEGIASMNFRELMRNNPHNEDITKEFDSNVFCSFPSNDKLMDLFLSRFEQNKNRYENDMNKRTGKILSCDHTFKTSKHIGVTREDGKFVHQFENVFLGVNENGEVLAWRFTKSTSSTELTDLLEKYKERLDRAGETLEMVLVDDCCHVRSLYQRIFPGVKILLDIFHACSRVVQTIPKSDPNGKQFSNEFSLIFRKDEDLGHERTVETACPDEIEANLERLLFSWRSKLREETLHQIDNLKKHICKGCVSGIPVGCGTEANERLHRHLKRTMLCGVPKIGPELAIAVMTCVLYAWNSKRKEKTSHNKRTAPIPPIEAFSNTVTLSHHRHIRPAPPTLLTSSVDSSCTSIGTSPATVTSEASTIAKRSVDELQTEVTVNYVLERILRLQDFLSAFNEQCKNRTVDVLSLLLTSPTAQEMIEKETEENILINFDLTAQRNDNLLRNLSGFNLALDATPRDGNCLFRSLVTQVYKHLEKNHSEELKQHLSALGLLANKDKDVSKLRYLFVQELTENIDEYRSWMSDTCSLMEIEKFKIDGHFASEVGDLCVRACAKILKIPIVLITSLPSIPSIPFLPPKLVTAIPVYVAFDHSGSGHYDATKDRASNLPVDESSTINTRCTCGKNSKDPSKLSCVTSKCQCKLNQQPCTRRCRCYNCTNKTTNSLEEERNPQKGCRCGSSTKAPYTCRDGKRKTKCPCVAKGVGCTDMCRCQNCANIIKAGGVVKSVGGKRIKRNRKNVSPYKRKKSIKFMEDEEASVQEGPWRLLETLCLQTCITMLKSNNISINAVNCGALYRYVVKSSRVKDMGLKIASKSTAQVAAKLAYQAKKSI